MTSSKEAGQSDEKGLTRLDAPSPKSRGVVDESEFPFRKHQAEAVLVERIVPIENARLGQPDCQVALTAISGVQCNGLLRQMHEFAADGADIAVFAQAAQVNLFAAIGAKNGILGHDKAPP